MQEWGNGILETPQQLLHKQATCLRPVMMIISDIKHH